MKAPTTVICFLFLFCSIFATNNLKAQNIKLETHEWWTSDHLHLFITQSSELPPSNNKQAGYFLNFKNKWTLEAEGLINHQLKKNNLRIESITAGESNFNSKHTLGIHVIMQQVPESKKHKACNLMAFVFTSTDASKNLKKSCEEKLNKELKSFKNDWNVLGFLGGDIKNDSHRIHWEGVVGIK